MELRDALKTRRMTRDFADTDVPDDLVSDLVDLASRAPSAGKTQGGRCSFSVTTPGPGSGTCRFPPTNANPLLGRVCCVRR